MPRRVNKLQFVDVIWRHSCVSTLAQVMAWCLTADMLSNVFCGIHLRAISQNKLYPQHMFGDYVYGVTTTSPRRQWVNSRSDLGPGEMPPVDNFQWCRLDCCTAGLLYGCQRGYGIWHPTDRSLKFYNAHALYPTMHHFGTKMCTFLSQNGVLWDMRQVHWVIYEIGLLVGITLLRLAGPNIGRNCLSRNGLWHHVTRGNFCRFAQTRGTGCPLVVLTAGNLPIFRAVQKGCERVYVPPDRPTNWNHPFSKTSVFNNDFRNTIWFCSQHCSCQWSSRSKYRKISNTRRTLVGNKIVDHSDVVGASPVGAAPTTSSFST